MRLEAYGRKGERIDLVAKDFFARVLQHETDHLNGKVYMDRMGDLTTLATSRSGRGTGWTGARRSESRDSAERAVR